MVQIIHRNNVFLCSRLRVLFNVFYTVVHLVVNSVNGEIPTYDIHKYVHTCTCILSLEIYIIIIKIRSVIFT